VDLKEAVRHVDGIAAIGGETCVRIAVVARGAQCPHSTWTMRLLPFQMFH